MQIWRWVEKLASFMILENFTFCSFGSYVDNNLNANVAINLSLIAMLCVCDDSYFSRRNPIKNYATKLAPHAHDEIIVVNKREGIFN